MARAPHYATRGGAPTNAAAGRSSLSSVAAETSRRWRWRTRTHGRRGRCWRAGDVRHPTCREGRMKEIADAHTESRRFAPALRVTRCSHRLNGTHGRKRTSGQYFWPNAPTQDVSQSRRGPGQPFAVPTKTTDAELALLLCRTDNRMKSGSPILQVAQGEVEVMADRSTRHAQSLVNGEVFETARLLRLVCAKSIRARERTLPSRGRIYACN